MVKGDADRARENKRNAFDKKYSVGDIAFSPLYGRCKILKINKKTATSIQVDKENVPVLIRGKSTEINIDKSYFNI